MELFKKSLHILVRNGKVVFLLRAYLAVNLVFFLFAAPEQSFSTLVIMFLKFVVIECVFALLLSTETTLVLRNVVTPDEEANDCVKKRVDKDEGSNNEIPIGDDLLFV